MQPGAKPIKQPAKQPVAARQATRTRRRTRTALPGPTWPDTWSPDESRAMRRAVELAARGRGLTSPNPAVGCVVLAPDGSVAGEGFHARAGRPHAEAVALAQAGDRARGGTVIVTLEPCRHTGRTPPCVDKLLAHQVRRVVYAVPDPTPQAGGGGVALVGAGVEVAVGLLAAEAELVNREWLHSVRTGRPFVTWKFAATLDGRTSAADGTSRWVSGERSRADVHLLRAESDAVMVGVGTVLADDPQLTVRLDGLDPAYAGERRYVRQPLRVVVDGRRRTPANAAVRDAAAPTLVVGPGDVAGDGDALDLLAVMHLLDRRQVRSVLLEGGPTLATACLRRGLVDRVVAYLAPTLLGAGAAALGDFGAATMADALRLQVEDVTVLDGDVRVSGIPVRPADGSRGAAGVLAPERQRSGQRSAPAKGA